MRAIQLKAVGEPETAVSLVDMPEPGAPKAGEVLIELLYAPVNINDFLMMAGKLPTRKAPGDTLGNEAVGRVLAVGSGVVNVKVLDLVAPPLYSGTWRQKMLVSAEDVFTLDPSANPEQLSMIRINPPTAGLMLSEYVDLQEGDWIVQNASNSGVGRSVIAIAKAHKQKTINLVRRKELIPELEKAGGDIVVLDEPGSIEQVLAKVGDGKVRLALDGVSGEATARLIPYLSKNGTLVNYAMMSGEQSAPADLRPLLGKSITLEFFYQGFPQFQSKIPSYLQHANRMIASGEIFTPIAKVYPMTAIQEAIAHVKRGGKILLDLTK